MLEFAPALIDQAKNIVLVEIKGVLDSLTAPELKRVLTKFIADGAQQLVLNLSQVDYIASSGWSVILGKLLELRDRGGDIYLLDMKPAVVAVFKLMGLDVSVRHFDSFAELMGEMNLSLVALSDGEGGALQGANADPAVDTLGAAIQKVVEEHPRWGGRLISRELSRQRGKPVSTFQVTQELVRLGLQTEPRRITFALRRSKEKGNDRKP